MVETDTSEIREKISQEAKGNLSVPIKEKKYINKFGEVDGQFSMFSDEPLDKPSEPLTTEANFKSISSNLYKKTFSYSDKVLFKKILSSIEVAIKKRA